jgi:hypothetical protein
MKSHGDIKLYVIESNILNNISLVGTNIPLRRNTIVLIILIGYQL